MVLEKPKGEMCGNCYYCTSFMLTYTEKTGMFSSKETQKEEFLCKRSPPLSARRGDGTNLVILDPSLGVVSVSKDHWCGEWKQRSN